LLTFGDKYFGDKYFGDKYSSEPHANHNEEEIAKLTS
jgi:hypothetical protein